MMFYSLRAHIRPPTYKHTQTQCTDTHEHTNKHTHICLQTHTNTNVHTLENGTIEKMPQSSGKTLRISVMRSPFSKTMMVESLVVIRNLSWESHVWSVIVYSAMVGEKSDNEDARVEDLLVHAIEDELHSPRGGKTEKQHQYSRFHSMDDWTPRVKKSGIVGKNISPPYHVFSTLPVRGIRSQGVLRILPDTDNLGEGKETAEKFIHSECHHFKQSVNQSINHASLFYCDLHSSRHK